MRHIILDTNIVVNFPEVLSKKQDDVKLIIPSDVIQQLLNYKSNLRQTLIAIIENAQNVGYVEIANTSALNTPASYVSKVGLVDANLIYYAKQLQDQGIDNVTLATKDKQLINFAKENNIDAIGYDELLLLFQKNSTTNNEIKNDTAELIG